MSKIIEIFSFGSIYNPVRSFLIILLFLFNLVLSAQVITYNKNFIFSNDSVEETCSGAVEVNGRQFIAGLTRLSDGDHIGIAEIDPMGNKIWTHIIGDSVNSFFTGGYNGLNRTSDGHLILTGSYRNDLDSTYYYARTFLMKLTCDGELVWVKMLNDSLYQKQWTFGVQVIETFDHGFAIIGQIGIMGALYKTDSLGFVQWYKTFGYGNYTWHEYVSSVEELPDHGFLLGGHSYIPQEYQSGDPRIYRLDSAGSIVWKKIIGGPHPDRNPVPLLLNDSVIIVLAPYTTQAAWFGLEQEIKLRILKLGLSSGKILSDTMYGDSIKLYVINQVRRLRDGTFIACGGDLHASLAWLFCFNENGDSLFFRNYSFPPPVNKQDFFVDFNSCIVCDDGGILIAGTYDPAVAGNDHWNGWLVKTDRYGCFEPGCDSSAIYILDHPDSVTVCRNIPAEIAITAIGSDRIYQWQVLADSLWIDITDTLIYKGINASLLLIQSSKLIFDNFWYRCRVFNSKYSLISDSTLLIIKDTVSFILQPVDQFVRKQDPALFTVTATGQEPLRYYWYRNGEPIPGYSNDTLIINPVLTSDTGIYFCRVINLCGQEDSRIAKLSINYTSVSLLKKSPVILYYPNPAEGFITIEINTGEKSNISLRIMDVFGKVLCERTVRDQNDYTDKIDLSGFDHGLYFLEIRIGDEIYQRKIIKW